jgi:hypothetical protein
MKLKKTASIMALVIATTSTTLPALSYAGNYTWDVGKGYTQSAETGGSRTDSGPSDEAVVAGLTIMALLGLCAMFCGSESQPEQETGEEYYYYHEDNAPSVQYGSIPVAPINSFYGDCHNPMGC